MDPIQESIFTTSENSIIWNAIAQNRLDDAQSAISSKTNSQGKSWFNYFKKRDTGHYISILQLASEILLSVPGKNLPTLHLLLNQNGDEQFAELVRLLFSLNYNGRFPSQVVSLAKMINDLLIDLAEQVRVQANDYPNNSIAGNVWFGGAAIREWSELLASYYVKVNDLSGVANTLQCKCKITCSIMSHYHHAVGPDMIAAAMALEAVGEIDLAKRYYKAVIADFECISDEIKNNPDEEVWEEQIISLQALQQAYIRMNSLDRTKQFDSSLQFIDTIIKQGVTKSADDEI